MTSPWIEQAEMSAGKAKRRVKADGAMREVRECILCCGFSNEISRYVI